jgi:hypothetical protein
MTMCSSSMNRMTEPLERRISSMMFFRRCSNSPRYLVPATTSARSRVSTRLEARISGTSPTEILDARPSTMAVLPTPGSPMSTGLFFVRRARIWIMRSISSARPMTGSSLPSRAMAVRSRPNSSSVGVLDLVRDGEPEPEPEEPEACWPPPCCWDWPSPSRLSTSSRTTSRRRPRFSSTRAATPSSSLIRPSSRCSVPT